MDFARFRAAGTGWTDASPARRLREPNADRRSYNFAGGEDLRQSRLLAGVYYTLRINANASGVVGLTWANKPEFVEGADRQLGANLGLSYKFNRGKEDEQD